MKKSVFLSFIMLSMLTMAGCSTNRSGNHMAYDLRKDKSAPNFMSNRNQDPYNPENVSNRGKDRQHLVENDITNQNPNLLDLNRTGNGGEAGGGNQGIDINKAKEVIANTDEFKTDSVWINGDRMWVSVYKKGILTDKDKLAAEARLHKNLIQALPQYNIEVRVQEDRR